MHDGQANIETMQHLLVGDRPAQRDQQLVAVGVARLWLASAPAIPLAIVGIGTGRPASPELPRRRNPSLFASGS